MTTTVITPPTTTTTATKAKATRPTAPTIDDMLAVAAAAKAKIARAAAADARRELANQKKEANEANTTFWQDLSLATDAAKGVAGYPGVTALMRGLSDVLSGTTPIGGACDHSALEAERDQAIADKDAAEANLAEAQDETISGSLASRLRIALEGNSNLQGQVTSLTGDLDFERDESKFDSLAGKLRRTYDLSDPDSLAGKLAAASVRLADVQAQIELLPEIDMTKTGMGNTVKVPQHDAEKINTVRSEVRGLFGI